MITEPPVRKLSMSLLLNDPSEFEGGDLEIANDYEVKVNNLNSMSDKSIKYKSFMTILDLHASFQIFFLQREVRSLGMHDVESFSIHRSPF